MWKTPAGRDRAASLSELSERRFSAADSPRTMRRGVSSLPTYSQPRITKPLSHRNQIGPSAVYSLEMDIDALHSTLLTVTLVSEKLSVIARELPGKNGTANIRRALTDAENDLRVAKATLAGELGFHVCPRCWPPELLTVDRQGAETCPACGQRNCDRAA
jgi:hypothetical protein